MKDEYLKSFNNPAFKNAYNFVKNKKEKQKIGVAIKENNMKVSPERIEIPNECPKDCTGKNSSQYQGNICSRCPIFNCKDGKDLRLMLPEEYRSDWAKQFKDWFDKKIDYPLLNMYKIEERV